MLTDKSVCLFKIEKKNSDTAKNFNFVDFPKYSLALFIRVCNVQTHTNFDKCGSREYGLVVFGIGFESKIFSYLGVRVLKTQNFDVFAYKLLNVWNGVRCFGDISIQFWPPRAYFYPKIRV